MSSFEEAVAVLFKHEGGLSHDTADLGGETKFGISKRAFPDLDIANLTQANAREIYRTLYWNPRFAEIHEQGLATELFEACVHMGTAQAVTLLQRALLRAGARVTVDALFGSQTLNGIYACDQQELMDEFKTEIIMFYVKLVDLKPEQEKFLRGWVKRAVS